jgi:2-keto-4-pentenoate hydratase/2-oxohepta-3-ene-1,7-dioic acid hydratase in catechol pathway
MIWCRFEVGDRIAYGAVEGDRVIEITGDVFGDWAFTTTSHSLAKTKLLVPVIPRTFFCVGLNYTDHIALRAQQLGKQPVFPVKPDIGYRANSALIAHDDDIVKPRDSGEEFQYEGELVAVFGKTAKHVPKENALDCVFGWTIGNDVSERTWQETDRTLWRAKNADTFKPMGPWIVTGLDPNDMTTIVRKNGTVTDSFATGNMLFDVATYISELTKYVTIQPGDVMWMGTDGLPRNMKPGDTVEIEITGIGVLRNRVVAEHEERASPH